MDSVSEASYKEIMVLLREARKVADSMGYMFENVDFDSVTGKRIHNLTITWAQPEEDTP